jgi:signal transduction histidine kinase
MRARARIRVLCADSRPLLRERIAAQPGYHNQLAQMFGPKQFRLKKALLLGLCVLLAGCAARNTNVGPSIEFTSIPVVGEGGPNKLDTIEGRVIQARPGQQIVLFARWGPWWVQPFTEQPFTKIQPDSTWRSSTHLGTQYAALLVDPGYRPPTTMDVLPNQGAGVIVVAITKGRPVFWQTWWFFLDAALAFAFVMAALFRVRMHNMTRQLSLRLEERLAERTRIAQELHDTLLQDFLSVSMQLHVANDQLAVDSPAKPLVTRALDMIGRVIEEGRNTVLGLRSSKWGSHELEKAFARIQEELAVTKGARFRVIVEGIARPLRPVIGDDVFLIGREALANAFHHSGASEIEVELEYAPDQLKLVVRDNGCGIAGDVLQSARDGRWGLSGMRERSGRIGAKLRVLSRPAAGTEIELSVPSDIAYLPRDSDRPVRWLSRLHPRKAKGADSPVESEQIR